MKVLLVQPKILSESSFPLGLAYLASSLKSKGFEVFGHDLSLESEESLKDKIKKIKPQLIGFTTIQLNNKDMLALARELKALSDAKIVFGGPQPTVNPGGCLKGNAIDFAIVGEGEDTIFELAETLDKEGDLSKINGLVYKKGGKIITNNGRSHIDDLDKIPFPDRFVFPVKKYCSGMVSVKTPYTSVVTSRGCSFKCKYCPSSTIWRGKWRARSPQNVVDEIEELVKVHGIRDVHFEDDNLTVDENHVYGICDELIERDLDVVWECPNGIRPESLNRRLLARMFEAGCRSMALGIESATPEILEEIGRESNLNIVEKIVDDAKKEGIKVCGYFMIGLPGETREMIDETIHFSRSLNIDTAHYSVFTPLQGSTYDDECLKDIFLSEKKLEGIRRRAYLGFYTKPRIINAFLRRVVGSPVSLLPLSKKIVHYAK